VQFVNTLAIRSQLSDEARDNEEWAKGVSQIHTRIGDIDIATNPAEALLHYQSALKIVASFFGRNRTDDPWQRELSWIFNKIGDVHRKRAEIAAATGDSMGKKTELVAALEAYDNSLCLRRGISARDPTKTELIRDKAYSLDRIGAARLALDDPAGTEMAYFESLQIKRKLVTSVKDNGLYLGDVGASLQLIGEYYLARTEVVNAVAFHEAAADVRTEALLRLPEDRRTQQNAERAGRTAQSLRERAAAREPSADFSGGWWRKRVEDVETAHAAQMAAPGTPPQDCWEKVVATADQIAGPSTTGSIP
jgi:hypothetical protein